MTVLKFSDGFIACFATLMTTGRVLAHHTDGRFVAEPALYVMLSMWRARDTNETPHQIHGRILVTDDEWRIWYGDKSLRENTLNRLRSSILDAIPVTSISQEADTDGNISGLSFEIDVLPGGDIGIQWSAMTRTPRGWSSDPPVLRPRRAA